MASVHSDPMNRMVWPSNERMGDPAVRPNKCRKTLFDMLGTSSTMRLYMDCRMDSCTLASSVADHIISISRSLKAPNLIMKAKIG